MAKANVELIQALRQTAERLSAGAPYQWGHMGSCNCGHLAQTITKLSKAEIHAHAISKASGEWAEQVLEFCPTSGYPMDHIIDSMISLGLSREDFRHLEKLSCQTILKHIPLERRNQMRHNYRDDVVLYLNTWANVLEDQIISETIANEEVNALMV